jgi:hypothetical protein
MGVKVFEFVRRAPGVEVDEFHRRWRDEYAADLMATTAAERSLRRLELNHRLPGDYARDRHAFEVADAGFDGVEVRWHDSLEDLEAFESDPEIDAVVSRHRGGLLTDDTMRVVTLDPDVIVDKPGRDTAGAKMLCILHRHRGLEAAPFHEHWRTNHGGLFQNIAELNEPLIGYDQNHGIETEAAFDGVTEQWFADLDTFFGSLSAEANVTDVGPDVAYMLDPASIHFIMAGQPTVVLG